METSWTLQMLADDAIFVRTSRGQSELVHQAGGLSSWERRFLSAVTGHTPLRVLLDLGFDEPTAAAGIERLLRQQLIGKVGDPVETPADALRRRPVAGPVRGLPAA